MGKNRTQTDHSEAGHIPCHVRHSIGLIRLLVSQLQAATCDNDHTMEQLANAHASIADETKALTRSASPSDAPGKALQRQLDQMVTAFQGHDSFNQRVEHIRNALLAIAEHFGDNALRNDDNAWEALSQTVVSSYTTAQEHYVHSAASPASNNNTHLHSHDALKTGSIELF